MFYAFSLPIKGTEVPIGSDWIHEIKYDGYRMMVIRSGDSVRLRSNGGLDWTKRYPLIVAAARAVKASEFAIDGEVVVLGPVSDFGALHSRTRDAEAQFYAFDVLAGEGDDYRKLPLTDRKGRLARLLKRDVTGIFVAPFEQGEIGAELFAAACRMGLEGIVSKHRRRPYGAGKCKYWIKVKNRTHPALARPQERF